MTFHFILLAAGVGSRFGSNKLLADLGGKALYRHGLDKLLALKSGEKEPITVTVVTQYPAIAGSLRDLPVTVAFNEEPSRGQTSSIQTGIRSLNDRDVLKEGDYLIFLAADQPYITVNSLRQYLHELKENEPLLAAYTCEGRYRNPGAFRVDLIPELMALKGDGGGREVLRAHKSDVMPFTAFSLEELRDIDRPEDLV